MNYDDLRYRINVQSIYILALLVVLPAVLIEVLVFVFTHWIMESEAWLIPPLFTLPILYLFFGIELLRNWRERRLKEIDSQPPPSP